MSCTEVVISWLYAWPFHGLNSQWVIIQGSNSTIKFEVGHVLLFFPWWVIAHFVRALLVADNLSCCCLFAAKVIKLSVVRLQLEESSDCHKDHVDMYDGLTVDGGQRLARLCGTALPAQPYLTDTNTAVVSFMSDEMGVDTGFRIEYDSQFRGKYRHSSTDSSRGNLTPKSYFSFHDSSTNSYYHIDITCYWLVTASAGELLIFVASSLFIPFSKCCRLSFCQSFGEQNYCKSHQPTSLKLEAIIGSNNRKNFSWWSGRRYGFRITLPLPDHCGMADFRRFISIFIQLFTTLGEMTDADK